MRPIDADALMKTVCIHEFACSMWNIGHIHEMDATTCSNYETVKDSAAYLIGRMDERKEGADNG